MSLIPYLSVFKVTGEDSTRFLNAQLAANTAELQTGQCRFAAYCSARGQVIALLLVCRGVDEYLVCAHAGLASVVVDRLRTYVLRDRVQLHYPCDMRVLGLPRTATDQYSGHVYVPAKLPFGYAFSDQSTAANHMPTPWKEMELTHGVTWVQPDSSERFIPQMLGFDELGAVSFNKGCYPGQEIIARTRYLGKLKRKPVLVRVSGAGEIPPGSGVLLNSAGQDVEAEVADCAVVNDGRYVLAFLVARLEPGEEVSALSLAGDSRPARRLYPDYG